LPSRAFYTPIFSKKKSEKRAKVALAGLTWTKRGLATRPDCRNPTAAKAAVAWVSLQVHKANLNETTEQAATKAKEASCRRHSGTAIDQQVGFDQAKWKGKSKRSQQRLNEPLEH
jgi:hypothetical protein